MPDTGVCIRCGAGEDGEEVEVNETSVCVDCEAEETKEGLGSIDMGQEDE